MKSFKIFGLVIVGCICQLFLVLYWCVKMYNTDFYGVHNER